MDFEKLIVRTEGAVLFAEIDAPPMNLEGPELVRDLVSLKTSGGRFMVTAGIVLATLKVAAAKLTGIKTASVLSFIGGAAMTLGFTNVGGSNPSRHVYELRLYQVNEGKMDALIARFGDHTDAIFKRHNMKSVGFWRPQDSPFSENMFVYILEHPSREEARNNWAAFQADPEWKRVKAESEINGPLAKHIDSYFMDPTSFSALK